MPVPQRNRLVEWFVLVKDEWLPVQRARLGVWHEAVREEPYLIWQTPAIRYSVYGLGSLLAIWALAWVVSLLEPAPMKDARPRAKTASFDAVCTEANCGHHFIINRKFGFRKFPVECPECRQRTGQRATRCHSSACRGGFVAPIEADGELRCRECGTVLGPAP